MAIHQISNINMTGMCSAVPAGNRVITDEYSNMGKEFVDRVACTTGVLKRHLAPAHICASDLAYSALKTLIEELNWSRDSIDCVVLVTQTPDYLLPNTGSVLHQRLGLNKNTIVFDVNLGCSGYIYGLWLVANLLNRGMLKRGLIVVADTISKIVNDSDDSLKLLFGDAASATALEYSEDGGKIDFILGNDGSKFDSLIVPSGLFRSLSKNDDIEVEKKLKFMKKKDKQYLTIDGPEMMNFILSEVPCALASLLESAKMDKSNVDYWVMHQANEVVLKNLAKKIGICLERMPFSLNEFGNTSSASIPLTISYKLREILRSKKLNLMLTGFGVGLSWGCSLIRCGNMVMPSIVYVD